MLSWKLEKAEHMAAGLRTAHDLFAFQILVFFSFVMGTSPQEYLLKVETWCGFHSSLLAWVKPVSTNLNKSDSVLFQLQGIMFVLDKFVPSRTLDSEA